MKVCDFGIAKGSGTTQTGSGQALGTPAYMSPEQADLSALLDGRSDLHALGVVLYELVEGRAPFLGDSPMQTMIMHREQAADRTRSDLCGRRESTRPPLTLPRQILTQCLPLNLAARLLPCRQVLGVRRVEHRSAALRIDGGVVRSIA